MRTRRAFLKMTGAGIAAGLAYSRFLEPERVCLERVTVRLARLASGLEGFRIAVLSDFHLHPYTTVEHVRAAVQVSNGLQPDLVVLLGDYVSATVEAIDELAPELAKLSSRLGIFGVLGNHDHWRGAGRVMAELQRCGISMLRNAGVALAAGGSELFLAGLESAWAGRPDLRQALANHRENAPAILLMHEPDYADTAAATGRVALQLSGHTHGGQVRLPGVGALRLPSWGQRYDAGLYRVGEMQVYTNRGIGLVGVPVRLNCPPEVTEITLAG